MKKRSWATPCVSFDTKCYKIEVHLGTISMISAILALDGMAEASTSLTLFSALPVELRCKIWENCYREPRNVEVFIEGHPGRKRVKGGGSRRIGEDSYLSRHFPRIKIILYRSSP